MATKKVGALIREARTDAELTQEQLARKIPGLSAEDISLAERGKAELTQAQLRQIAKATGVTQASLINAAKEEEEKKTAKKTAQKKTTTAKKTSGTSMKVTAAEKKLLELYREADADTKKDVLKLLKGEEIDGDSLLEGILGTVAQYLEEKK